MSFVFMVGCTSVPKDDRPASSCMKTVLTFMESHQSHGDSFVSITGGDNHAYVVAVDSSTAQVDYLLIADIQDHARFGAPVGICRNNDKVLNIFMVKAK